MTPVRQLFIGPMNRALRRVLVIVIYAIPLFVFGTGQYEQGRLNGWSSLLVLSGLLLLRLSFFSQGVLKKARGTHDERQRELVLRSHSVTYWVIAVPMLLTILVYMFGGVGSALFELLLFTTFYLVFFLPITVIAWLEPNPPTEDSKLDLTLKGDVL